MIIKISYVLNYGSLKARNSIPCKTTIQQDIMDSYWFQYSYIHHNFCHHTTYNVCSYYTFIYFVIVVFPFLAFSAFYKSIIWVIYMYLEPFSLEHYYLGIEHMLTYVQRCWYAPFHSYYTTFERPSAVAPARRLIRPWARFVLPRRKGKVIRKGEGNLNSHFSMGSYTVECFLSGKWVINFYLYRCLDWNWFGCAGWKM